MINYDKPVCPLCKGNKFVISLHYRLCSQLEGGKEPLIFNRGADKWNDPYSFEFIKEFMPKACVGECITTLSFQVFNNGNYCIIDQENWDIQYWNPTAQEISDLKTLWLFS